MHLIINTPFCTAYASCVAGLRLHAGWGLYCVDGSSITSWLGAGAGLNGQLVDHSQLPPGADASLGEWGAEQAGPAGAGPSSGAHAGAQGWGEGGTQGEAEAGGAHGAPSQALPESQWEDRGPVARRYLAAALQEEEDEDDEAVPSTPP